LQAGYTPEDAHPEWRAAVKSGYSDRGTEDPPCKFDPRIDATTGAVAVKIPAKLYERARSGLTFWCTTTF
jgi:hypothetical protein